MFANLSELFGFTLGCAHDMEDCFFDVGRDRWLGEKIGSIPQHFNFCGSCFVTIIKIGSKVSQGGR